MNEESETITITSKHGNAVLIGEDAWHAIQETFFLTSIPGMTESIHQAQTLFEVLVDEPFTSPPHIHKLLEFDAKCG